MEGRVEIPSSYREMARAFFLSLFASGETTLSPLPRCAGTEALMAFIKSHFQKVRREGDALVVTGTGSFAGNGLPQEIDIGDHPEFLEGLFPLFFHRGALFKGNVQALRPRFRRALKQLEGAGFSFSLQERGSLFHLEVMKSSPNAVEVEFERAEETVRNMTLLALLSAATGENRIVEGVPFRSELDTLLHGFKASFVAHHKGDAAVGPEEDEAETNELEKRIRRLQTKKEKSGEKPLRVLHIHETVPLRAATLTLPGDPLLAAPFLLSGLLIGNSVMTVSGPAPDSLSALLNAFRRMGGPIETVSEKGRDMPIWVARTGRLTGRRISGELTASLGELFPFVALAAAYADGQSVIRDALFLREGATDLISATLHNLKAMGVKVGEIDDGLVIEGAREYDGGEFDTFGEPALGLAMSVAAAKNKGESIIRNAEAIDQVWPDFHFCFQECYSGVE